MTRLLVLIFFIIISSFSCQGQKCVRILSTMNEDVPFATIVNSDNSYGTYTNEKGNVCIDINLLSDTIIISSVGYKKLVISKKKYLMTDKFILEEIIKELKEVIVKPSKIERNLFYSYNKVIISVWKQFWNPNTNLLITGFIENPSESIQIIEKIKFTFLPEKSDIISRFKVRFRFFENKNDKPSAEITQTNIITELSPTDKFLEYDISNYNMSFPKTGVWIGMEVVGYYNLDNKFIPLENGKAGKAIYRNNGKIRKINTVSPSYDLVKTKNEKPCYTKDFLNRWSRGIIIGNSGMYYNPKIEITTIEN